jgi:hypothetical protein
MKYQNDELFQIWVRESPRQFVSCALLSKDESLIISEGAFTAQRFNSILIDSILDISELVDSPNEFVKTVKDIILVNSPNKS